MVDATPDCVTTSFRSGAIFSSVIVIVRACNDPSAAFDGSPNTMSIVS